MMIHTLTTFGLYILILVIDLMSLCVTSPVLLLRSTTATTTTVLSPTSDYVMINYTITTTQTNVTCSQRDCSTSTNRADLATTILLRILIIAGCIFVFVGLVKLSEVVNRRCTCRKKQEIYFTRI